MKLTPMLDKTKVKFNDKGHLLVDVPYKNGSVTWGLGFAQGPGGVVKMDWILYDKPENYNPKRVTNDHRFILSGKKLRAKMIKKAAAKHRYSILDKLKTVS